MEDRRRESQVTLTFDELAETNRTRCQKWHNPDTEPWTGADWSNAMCGEAGEAANVVKKLRRCETRTSSPMDPPEDQLRRALSHEIADVILYAFLLADHYDINVERAVIEKFNLVSERQGFPDRLDDGLEDWQRVPQIVADYVESTPRVVR